jgi:integrase
MQGLRWGELAGLQVGDRVMVPGPGLRLSRAVLASNGGGELYLDTLKNKRARTVPLVPVVVPIVDRWSADKSPGEWLFAAPAGGPLRETNWQRSISWREAKATIGRPELRVHDLRHTAASVWLTSGADPKVVQRVLGHATADMTMDLYGHMIDRNLWDAAEPWVSPSPVTGDGRQSSARLSEAGPIPGQSASLNYVLSASTSNGVATGDDATLLGYPPSMKKIMSTTLARV